MTDRELLERAANAVGYVWDTDVAEYRAERSINALWITSPKMNTGWDPLEHDADALRLACDVKLSISMRPDGVMVVGDNYVSAFEKCNAENRRCATRRAIVRAAAQMVESDK